MPEVLEDKLRVSVKAELKSAKSPDSLKKKKKKIFLYHNEHEGTISSTYLEFFLSLLKLSLIIRKLFLLTALKTKLTL